MNDSTSSQNDFDGLEVDIDDYEKVKQIGRGGSAIVYLARNKKSDELVALKEFTGNLSKKSIKIIKREISTQIQIDHPFVIHLIGYSNFEPFTIVEEYASQGTLFKYLHSNSKSRFLDATRKNIIAMGIAHAMATLHSQGVIHRDLKSTNILIDDYFYPKICDFGISRQIMNDETLTCNVGAPQWMAPEVFTSGNYSFPSDVYSYGSLLYEICTGTIPWESIDISKIERVVIEGQRPKIPNNCPKSIKNLIKSCWQEDPDSRPTFSEIYQQFTSKQIMFDGCDESEITFLQRKLNKLKQRRGSYASKPKQSNTIKSNKPQSLSDAEFQNKKNHPAKRSEKSTDFVDLSAIKNTRDFFFRPELKKASKKLMNVQSRSFFKVIKQFMVKQPMKAEMISILECVSKVIQKKFHFQIFISMKIHEMLPFDREELIDYCLDIILLISQQDPSILLHDFENNFKIILKMRPQKLIIIFSHMKDLIIGSYIEDFLFNYADSFIRSEGSPEFVSLLFEMCQNKEFLKQNKEDVFNIFNAAISSYKSANLALNAICHFSKIFESKISELDYETISGYLVDDEFKTSALDLLLHIEEIPPQRNLISSLLFCSKFDEKGNLCLLKIIGLEEGARQLLTCKKWLRRDNPTIFGTLKFVLAILVHQNLISDLKNLTDFCGFLSRLIDECDDRILIHISVILSRLNIDSEFAQNLQKSDIVRKICNCILEFDMNTPEYLSCIDCISIPANVCYFEEFLDIIPKLKETLISDSESVPMTIYVITTLSKYRECADVFKKMKFDKYFRNLMKDHDYKVYAKRYFKNMLNYE